MPLNCTFALNAGNPHCERRKYRNRHASIAANRCKIPNWYSWEAREIIEIDDQDFWIGWLGVNHHANA